MIRKRNTSISPDNFTSPPQKQAKKSDTSKKVIVKKVTKIKTLENSSNFNYSTKNMF